MKVCIVGNGPSAINKHLGQAIDQHDIVVRCNTYVTDGYEQYVGSRTTHWYRNTGALPHRPDTYQGVKLWIPLHVPVRRRKKYLNHLINQHTKRYKHFSLVDANRMDLEARKAGLPKRVCLSTGVAAIIDWLDVAPQVSIVGFDHFLNKGASHYYEDRDIATAHLATYEKLYVDRLGDKVVRL